VCTYYQESVPQNIPSAERDALLKILHMPPGTPYCLVPGRLFKIHPNFDRAVQSILAQNPGAFVVFIYEKAMTGLSFLLAQRLQELLTESEMQRIRFGSMKYFRPLTKFATIALDTFPYGGDIFVPCLCFL
jgi:predicted O-linked N-acetylglucosamine transferase (SPINDLY family)